MQFVGCHSGLGEPRVVGFERSWQISGGRLCLGSHDVTRGAGWIKSDKVVYVCHVLRAVSVLAREQKDVTCSCLLAIRQAFLQLYAAKVVVAGVDGCDAEVGGEACAYGVAVLAAFCGQLYESHQFARLVQYGTARLTFAKFVRERVVVVRLAEFFGRRNGVGCRERLLVGFRIWQHEDGRAGCGALRRWRQEFHFFFFREADADSRHVVHAIGAQNVADTPLASVGAYDSGLDGSL